MKILIPFLLLFALIASSAQADDRLAATAAKVPVSGALSSYTPPIYDVWSTGAAPLKKWSSSAAQTSEFLNSLSAIPTLPWMVPATGTDGEAVIQDHVRNQTIELWKVDPINLRAAWGGRADNSAFTQTPWGRVWPTPNNVKLGVQASGLAFTPGLITVADLRSGVIKHALHLEVTNSCRSFVPPATRTDQTASTDGTNDCYKYGTAWKLPQSYVIPSTARPVIKEMMQAAKDYGIIATDATHYGLQFRFENWNRPYAPWKSQSKPVDPYRDPNYPTLNLFGCKTANDWSCYPDKNNLFKIFGQVTAGNTESFWKALVKING